MSIRDAHAMALLVVRQFARSSDDPELSELDPADLFVQGDREVQLERDGRRFWGVIVCVTDGAGWDPEVLVSPTARGGTEARFLGS